MFSVPEIGWVNVTVGSYTDRASYLTDVPTNCLDSAINALKNNLDFCVYFDAEGWDYRIIGTRTQAIIILNDEEIRTTDGANKFTIAQEIFNDISEHVEEWARWYYFEEIDPVSVLENNRNEINQKLSILKALLDEENAKKN